MNAIPETLTWLRAGLGPVMILLVYVWPDTAAFAVCLIAAFFSDVFDGILARRLGIATARLRRLDSVADSIFYVCALWAMWRIHPSVIQQHLAMLAALFAVEGLRYALDLWKFGREASYHMWSSKLWGIALFCGFFSVMVFGNDGALVTAALVIGIAADVEGLAISAVLGSWHHDVPTLAHALQIRARENAVPPAVAERGQ